MKGENTTSLEKWFKQRFSPQAAVSFSTGREALAAVLASFGLGHGDEVIIQAYTCIVVPHAVLWSGAKPVYVDIDDSLNIDPGLLESRITSRTKAVIVQHTFGMPADMPKISEICRRRGLLLIEDCAHSLGASIEDKEVGLWGDAAIFSFGRDKVVSGVSGGMAIMHQVEPAKRLIEMKQEAPQRPRVWVLQNILHPVLTPVFLRWMSYRKIGGIGLKLAQMLGLLNKVYSAAERSSQAPKYLYHVMPNSMASLALQQLEQSLPLFHKHRIALATHYLTWAEQQNQRIQERTPNSRPAWLRFTLFTPHPHKLITKARSQGYILGDWYTHVIMPRPVDDHLLEYEQGSCPKAEAAAQQSINLPTHIFMNETDAKTLTKWIEQQI